MLDRRSFLKMGAAGSALLMSGLSFGESKPVVALEKKFQGGVSPWPISLNSSCIRPTPFLDKIDVAVKAGYDGFEPWINELEDYEKGGGDLKELAKQIKDKGLFVPNVIGLWGCMPPTQEEFDKSLVETRERMRRCAAVGAQHVAAIPAPDREDFNIDWAVKCYKELLRIGREEYGIIVAFEFVGFMKGIHNFGVAAGVAIDTDDSDACLIMDTFHMYRGCSGYNGLKHINGSLIANFHWNDLPTEPEREKLSDEHRIYPGDGMLPLKQVLKDLVSIGYTGPLSIEMFNREHWAQDPLLVAKTAKEKTCALIKEALA